MRVCTDSFFFLVWFTLLHQRYAINLSTGYMSSIPCEQSVVLLCRTLYCSPSCTFPETGCIICIITDCSDCDGSVCFAFSSSYSVSRTCDLWWWCTLKEDRPDRTCSSFGCSLLGSQDGGSSASIFCPLPPLEQGKLPAQDGFINFRAPPVI